MSDSSDIPGRAAVSMPYGCPVKPNAAGDLVPARLELNRAGNPVPGADDDLAVMVGVLRRPSRTADLHNCAPGDDIRVKTDGHVLALVGDDRIAFQLRGGRPIERT